MMMKAASKAIAELRRRRNPRWRLLARMPRHAVCAEIGVWKGDFSDLILRCTEPRVLHLVDPWAFQADFPERMYGGSVARSQSDMDGIFEGVRHRFAGRPDVRFHREKSANALPRFPDACFDWVYVDGNHYYEFVREDLELCREKVRPGGWITGDDYDWGEVEGSPVARAVQDFVAAHGLQAGLELIGNQFLIHLPD